MVSGGGKGKAEDKETGGEGRQRGEVRDWKL